MINKVQALFYKGFKYIDVNLKSFILLVGPNASGKSTFLDIFTFVRDVLNEGPVKAVQKRSAQFLELVWNQGQNRFEFVIEFAIPKNKIDKYHIARYEISIAQDQEQGIIIDKENLWLKKKGLESNKKNLNDLRQTSFFPREPKSPKYIVLSHKRTPSGWRKVISQTPQGNDYFRSETTEWNMTYRFGPTKASLAQIPEDEERFPITLWVKRILTESVQFLQLNSKTMRRPCRPDTPVTFQVEGDNLPKVIKHLYDNYPENFNRWIKHVKIAIPEIEKVSVQERPEDRFLYLYAQQPNGLKIPSWLLSDGTLRLFAQTIIAYLPEQDKLYMIEEPENGLHPLAIESVYQSLSSVYENQILLATHSPAILRLAEPKDILCFSKTDSGVIDVRSGENHPKLKDWKKGVDLATLHAAGVLQ